MIDMQRINDLKVYVGSFVTVTGSAWTWLGTNYQSIGAVLGIMAFVYTTVVFIQGQRDRYRKRKGQ